MKRRLISEGFAGADACSNYIPVNIPDDLKDYADGLRLLNGVPLTYLLSDVSDLNEESIRFFILDINWTDALLDGAFSIGRICNYDSVSDMKTLNAAKESRSYLDSPRIKRMHPNHKNILDTFMTTPNDVDYKLISGFIMRSQLVSKMKGLLLYGYDKDGAPKTNYDDGTPLNILRMETIADDILICLFQGEIYQLLIAEPKTGLCFGVSSVDESGGKTSRSIDLRSALDDSDLGKRIDSFRIDDFTDDNGKLHAKNLAKSIETQLKNCGKLGVDKITPSRFTFEMIAVAHRAKFTSS